jgi:hypothetical protein
VITAEVRLAIGGALEQFRDRLVARVIARIAAGSST